MFGGKRRAIGAELHPAEPRNGTAEVATLGAPQTDPSAHASLTLNTACACGHPRKDHRGLRMDICGPCLECECQEFSEVDDTLGRLRAVLAQTERLQETAEGLRARLTGGPGAAAQPTSNGNGNGHL
jgi:hypothetical protein